MGVGPDPDAGDENPDLWELFQHYDKLYFRGALADAAFCVEWAAPRTNTITHGPVFRDWMDAINTCPIEDYTRPISGYCITTTHDFSQEKSCNIQGFLWKCESCGDTLVRAKSLGPPSDFCCIENVSQHPTCGNMLCHWHK